MNDHLNISYEADFILWLDHQMALMRARDFAQLDLENLLAEVKDLGDRMKRELEHRLELLLMHLLKYRFQPQRISRSWKDTIREQRTQIKRLLRDAPSLKATWDTQINISYAHAVARAAEQTHLPRSAFPAELPFTREQLLDDEYFPSLQE